MHKLRPHTTQKTSWIGCAAYQLCSYLSFLPFPNFCFVIGTMKIVIFMTYTIMRVKLCFANLLKSCSIMLLKREIVLPCFVYIFLLAKNICTAYSFIVYLVKILSWYSSKIVLYLPSLLRHDSSFPIAPFTSKLRISSKYKTYQSTS